MCTTYMIRDDFYVMKNDGCSALSFLQIIKILSQ